MQITTLQKIESARTALVECSDLWELREMQSQAEALRSYAEARDRGGEAHAAAWELVQIAKRRIGEITIGIALAKPGPSPKTQSATRVTKQDTIRNYGFSNQEVYRAERLAKVPSVEFAERIALGKARILRRAEGPLVASPSWDPEYSREKLGIHGPVFSALLELAGPDALVITGDEPDRWSASTVIVHVSASRRGLLSRLVAEFAAGSFRQGIAVISRPGTGSEWFQRLGRVAKVLFAEGRQDVDCNGIPIREDIAVFYVGDRGEAFTRGMRPFGLVMEAVP